MVTTLKSEFRKLLTVRSTYIVTASSLLLVTFFSIYVFGYQQASQQAVSPLFLADTLYNMLGIFLTFAAILSILHVAHEYRYNTILYTFTANRSRLKVLLSKIIVMLTYTTIIGLVTLLIAYFGSKLGLSLRDASLAPQSFDLAEVAWQYLAYSWGYVLTGMILAVIIRGLVGSIVAFFLIPTIEGILSLILKGNTKYLPFRSLDAIAATPSPAPIAANIEVLSHAAAIGIFSIYLLIFGGLAVYLFVKRDALD